jgi:hypothetical protein
MLIFFGHASSLVNGYYKVFGQTFIKNDRYFAAIGSINSAANVIGAFFWGFLIDKLPFKVSLVHLLEIKL